MFTEEAQKLYQQKQNDLLEIVNTNGFKRLVEFFEIELQGIDVSLTNSKTPEEAYDWVLRRRPVARYLFFLKNITTTSPSKKV